MKRRISCTLGLALLILAGRAESQTPSRPPTLSPRLPTPSSLPLRFRPGTCARSRRHRGPAAQTPPPQPAASSSPSAISRIYYGTSVGFSFWNDYMRISVEPLVGWKLTPKLSAGLKFRYEYLNDDRGANDYDAHNFGGSVFSRYRLIPRSTPTLNSPT